MKMTKHLFLISFVFMGFKGFSQYTEVINSNRPGVSHSAFAVGTNVGQLEVGGYLVEEQHNRLNYDVSGFGIDFSGRYGLMLEELELVLDGVYQRDTYTDLDGIVPEDHKRSNFKRITFGAKYLVYDPNKNYEDKPNLYSWKANHSFKLRSLIPAVAVYAGANFDSKDNPYTAHGIEGISPKVMIATQNNFSGGWVLVLNFLMDRIGTDQSDFQYVATLTHSFHPQWAIFGETQGIKSDFYADNLFRLGLGYLWTEDLQLDASATLNTKDTPSVFNVNFGVSYRFDFHSDKSGGDNGTSAKDERKRRERGQQGRQDGGGQKQQVDFE